MGFSLRRRLFRPIFAAVGGGIPTSTGSMQSTTGATALGSRRMPVLRDGSRPQQCSRQAWPSNARRLRLPSRRRAAARGAAAADTLPPDLTPPAGGPAIPSASPTAADSLAPARQALADPVPWVEAGQGLALFSDGSASFRVWAPHASAVTLQVVPGDQFIPTLPASSVDEAEGAVAAPQEMEQPGLHEFPLSRHGDDWGTNLVS